MKFTKKNVLIVALAVCLLAVISMGTLAWFTDSDEVTNDFYFANSEDDADKIFSVDVWEDDDDGVDEKLDSITYDDLLPGDNLYKEVNIENTGYYAQYIRAIVTVTDAHVWQELNGVVYVPLNKIATDLNADYEVYRVVYDAEADTLTYVLYYKNILGSGVVSNLFTNIHIPEAMTQYQAADMSGDFLINVVADALQTENVGDNGAIDAFAFVGKGVEKGNFVINLNEENVEDILAFLAKNEIAVVDLDLTGITVEGDAVANKGDLTVKNGTLNANNYVVNYGKLAMNGTEINKSGDGYAVFNYGTAVFNETDIDTAGGGINVQAGAQVTFNSGKIDIDSTATSQRHIFYAAGEGTKVVINGGEFSFEAYRQRSYACAQNGAVIEINGGTFGVAPNHPRWTHPIYVTDTASVVIKGGTFGFDPTNWVAEGYEAVQSGSTWTVQPKA